MENIKHIVYLMLENRSLDNVLGWLYEKGERANTIGAAPRGYRDEVFEGLQSGNYVNPTGDSGTIAASMISPSQGQQIPAVDPHEKFDHVKTQMATTKNITMGGFYNDFSTVAGAKPEQIMQCYSPESLPILNFLAKNFAVSDAYFSSIPSQTNSNRAFSLTGNSIGYWDRENYEQGARVNNEWGINPFKDFLDPFVFTKKTIWNVISEHFGNDDDWKIFYSQLWPDLTTKTDHIHYEGKYCFTRDLLWPNIGDKAANFQSIDQFWKMAADGTLPKFSYLEPLWLGNGDKDGIVTVGHNGNSYHPPADLAPGEQFLYALYNNLKNSPEWDNTLLIINFDEHGGTYDHVVPFANATTPWASPTHGTKDVKNKEEGFQFDKFGVRVPLILVSPRVDSKTVFRSEDPNRPFDHTSVIATILNWLKIPKEEWKLGSRTYSACEFGNVVNLASPRTNIPPMPKPLHLPEQAIEHPPADLHHMIVKRIFARAVRQLNYPKEKFQSLYKEHFKSFKTLRQMNEAAQTIIAQMQLEIGQEQQNAHSYKTPETSFWQKFINFLKTLFHKKDGTQ